MLGNSLRLVCVPSAIVTDFSCLVSCPLLSPCPCVMFSTVFITHSLIIFYSVNLVLVLPLLLVLRLRLHPLRLAVPLQLPHLPTATPTHLHLHLLRLPPLPLARLASLASLHKWRRLPVPWQLVLLLVMAFPACSLVEGGRLPLLRRPPLLLHLSNINKQAVLAARLRPRVSSSCLHISFN